MSWTVSTDYCANWEYDDAVESVGRTMTGGGRRTAAKATMQRRSKEGRDTAVEARAV